MAPPSVLQAMEVTGLSADSRRIEPGHLFAALPGSRHDGRDFIEAAVAQGAIAVLAPPGTELRDHGRPVALIADDMRSRFVEGLHVHAEATALEFSAIHRGHGVSAREAAVEISAA